MQCVFNRSLFLLCLRAAEYTAKSHCYQHNHQNDNATHAHNELQFARRFLIFFCFAQMFGGRLDIVLRLFHILRHIIEQLLLLRDEHIQLHPHLLQLLDGLFNLEHALMPVLELRQSIEQRITRVANLKLLLQECFGAIRIVEHIFFLNLAQFVLVDRINESALCVAQCRVERGEFLAKRERRVFETPCARIQLVHAPLRHGRATMLIGVIVVLLLGTRQLILDFASNTAIGRDDFVQRVQYLLFGVVGGRVLIFAGQFSNFIAVPFNLSNIVFDAIIVAHIFRWIGVLFFFERVKWIYEFVVVGGGY
mmetsp:Transcript_43618/g.72037  ORF Transcript_43618/g.72037 Transcript_43618/m.72037 type:complete len:308 (+) Transcript_43618:151-1074(+)